MTDFAKYMKRKCPVCGVIYEADRVRLSWGRQTTCSRSCSYRRRGSNLSDQVDVTCATCGKKFSRSSAQIESKHKSMFCSRTCQYSGRTLGHTARIVSVPYIRVAPPNPPEFYARVWEARRRNGTDRHTEETKAKLREATARAIAENRVATTSKLENIVASVLDDLRIRYIRQYPVRGPLGRYVGVVDFLLPDKRALEVNGTFWHCDPRVYPDGPVHAVQRRDAAAWVRKVDALTALSIPIVCVWEIDIRKDATEAVAIALATV